MMIAFREDVERRIGAPMTGATRILPLILAVMLVPAFAAAQAARDAPRGNPRLASLQAEIWPEYDRPAAALVILKGEIAPEVPLPAAVSLRIPASSRGPSAVAYAPALGGSLANLKHDRVDEGGFITLKFEAPERVIHIEFYEPIVTSAPGRSYTYTWTGDLATDRLRVVLQEPAAASEVSVQPALVAAGTGQDGLRYRSADLGPFQAGKRLEVNVRYTKTDPRASTEILKPEAASASPPRSSESSSGPSKLELAAWLVGIVAVLGLGLGVWAAMMWWYGREHAAAPKPGDAGFCRKCGAPRASGDRFCSKCGVKLT